MGEGEGEKGSNLMFWQKLAIVLHHAAVVATIQYLNLSLYRLQREYSVRRRERRSGASDEGGEGG